MLVVPLLESETAFSISKYVGRTLYAFPWSPSARSSPRSPTPSTGGPCPPGPAPRAAARAAPRRSTRRGSLGPRSPTSRRFGRLSSVSFFSLLLLVLLSFSYFFWAPGGARFVRNYVCNVLSHSSCAKLVIPVFLASFVRIR